MKLQLWLEPDETYLILVLYRRVHLRFVQQITHHMYTVIRGTIGPVSLSITVGYLYVGGEVHALKYI